MKMDSSVPPPRHWNVGVPGQVVLVFQGGGALGAYQAGVYQAMHDAEIEPNWIIGTSIGAINAALIAGNQPDNRVGALKAFWRGVTAAPYWGAWSLWPPTCALTSQWTALCRGIPGFFEPNAVAFLGPRLPLGPESAGYYSMTPLKRTLAELVDFALINGKRPRLTIGAAHIRTSQMHYFDNRKRRISLEHILASGALPPAFPPVRVDGELFWDGGVLSNTPTEVVFKDDPRRNSLIFAVHVWQPVGPEPETMSDVLHRQKDIQYSSRMANDIAHQQEMHRLRHIITALGERLPEGDRNAPEVAEMVAEGCPTRMHIVQLLAPRLENENENKDLDFSAVGIEARWAAGYDEMRQAIERRPWQGVWPALDGVVLHERCDSPAMDELGRPIMEGSR
jgi:NTE family protein